MYMPSMAYAQKFDSRLSTSLNRALSIRSNKSSKGSRSGPSSSGKRGGFSLNSLRGAAQPELSRRLYKLIKSDNNVISAYEAAGRERVNVATQLSEWGEQTGDDAISDISDKVGVLLSELGEQEDSYAHALDDSRGVLKQIRNTEKSVQPSRDHKVKLADEIGKLKLKEPENQKLLVLEQELVRAEAENLVAEAQLTNITRQKLKEAYAAEFAATIERAEKQIILAKHGRRLLNLLDDSPVIPGDARSSFTQAGQARQILNDAEDDLREWQPELEDVSTASYHDARLAGVNSSTNGRSLANRTRSHGSSRDSSGRNSMIEGETAVEANPHRVSSSSNKEMETVAE